MDNTTTALILSDVIDDCMEAADGLSLAELKLLVQRKAAEQRVSPEVLEAWRLVDEERAKEALAPTGQRRYDGGLNDTSLVVHGDAARPTRKYRPNPKTKSAVQLAAMLDAVAVRDELAKAPADRRSLLRRWYQAKVAVVVEAFEPVTRTMARRCRGVDYMGRELSREDIEQAACLGIAEAVSRYDAAKANGGCVYYVTARIRWALQQLTGSARQRQVVVGLEDAGC